MILTREEVLVLKALRNEVANGNLLLGAGVGTGISAKSAESEFLSADIKLIINLSINTTRCINL